MARARLLLRTLVATAVLSALVPSASSAQSEGATVGPAQTWDGPPAPVAPATIVRDDRGRATVRAVRLAEPLHVDGRLDENVYKAVPPIDGFIQQDPVEGVPATQPTNVWILFTKDTLYITCRCLSSTPDRLVANEMRRDSRNIIQNDNFAVVLDTFLDGRSGFLFHTNPVAAMYDALISDEGTFNPDWSTVWHVRSGRFEQGWIVEMAVPFRSLRYRSPGPQVWGINFRRIARAQNEASFLTRVARPWGFAGIAKLSLAATVVGIEIEQGSRPLEIKPYAIGGVITDQTVTPSRIGAWTADGGGDLKYGLTQGLTLDVTVNTDFAQVEADEAQVNLTRFSLFFPEKREFFLEGQGIFNFGGIDPSAVDAPVVFFSRRIGLEKDQTVPIVAGGRVTGRAGRYSIGGLTLRQGEGEDGSTEATTFTVARVKRDVGRRHMVGALLTHRSVSASGRGDNLVVGGDASLWFSSNATLFGYYVRSNNADDSSGASYRTKFNLNGDLYGISADYLAVDPDFDPDVGYVQRADVKRLMGRLRWSPRPASIAAIRKFDVTSELTYTADVDWRLQNRLANVFLGATFNSGDVITLRLGHEFERLDEVFDLADTATIPPGEYTADEINLIYTVGARRRINGTFGAQHGTFYGGNRSEVDVAARAEITPQLSVEPRVNINWIDVDFDPKRFRTTLAGARVTFTMTPRMFVSALLQYISTQTNFGSNIRFRWEFQPGSDLFVVYGDSRDTEIEPSLQSRSLVVKISKLFRF